MENIMSDIALQCDMNQEKVRELNFHGDGHVTHFGKLITNCFTQLCWDECLRKSDFYNRQEEIAIFNRDRKWVKRGISMIPLQAGTAIVSNAYHEGGAVVQVYSDGTVLLLSGGVEFGQGLHTKLIQIASYELGIPSKYISISDPSTQLVPNSGAAASSHGTDTNGMAVKLACAKIRRRLQPFVDAKPEGTWNDWVMQAYLDAVNLSATANYSMGPTDINSFYEKKLR
ncbi:xanthine dehydrogenase/oxidase-like [Ptychodera flava]|uniref:xanthine dehydrogenase/oxidase-like n=1 Tax=Ptychodera flava TaxID=63121 RepID=UPI003969EB3C